MDQTGNEPLERLTKIVTRAGGISDDEAERIGSSPFLHARLRAGIESERRRRAEQGNGWLAMPMVAWRAIAVTTIMTIAAVTGLWISKATARDVSTVTATAADPVSRVMIGGTCALSATAECAISTGEVLATLFSDNGGKEQ
jgi:hypothetical protein